MAVIETGHAAASAVDDLYRRHGGEVYRYALAVLGNHADAEDVTQTTFLNAYRSLEQGVRPRKPSNWLLTIASNTIKQRFRKELARPRQVQLDERVAEQSEEETGPSVSELLVALSKIPPQQRQAIVLREFEGRSYKEIAEILGVTTSALETLLFRARRSLTEELDHQLTCTEAQLAVSRASDGRLGRKERRRLREHLGECPDCAHFARLQHRHRRALKGLTIVPVPISLSLFKGIEGTATAATLPAAGATTLAVGSGVGAASATGGGVFAGGLALKAAAVVTAATVAGGVGVAGASEAHREKGGNSPAAEKPGQRPGQVSPRRVFVPGRGVARGKADAPRQTNRFRAHTPGRDEKATPPSSAGRSARAKPSAPGQSVRPAVAPRAAKAKSLVTHRARNGPKARGARPEPRLRRTANSPPKSRPIHARKG
jgi:RNA polymerase sigma factor (sigma-70 family)